MLTNLTTKETIPLSESAVNVSEETTKRWEIGGAIWPRWSRDGKQIAYLKKHTIRDDKEDPLDESEVWVVDADGTHRQKVFDKMTAYAWSANPVGLIVMSGDKIVRITPASGDTATVASVTAGKAPAKAAAATGEMKAPGAIVSYTGIDPAYARAILTLASEARAIYAGKFGFAMPEEVTVEVKKDSRARTNLWTDGDSQVFLTVKSNADLAPPEKSGYFNVYGICHELGHISLYRNIVNLGLPPGVAEGWPHYTGSIVVDEVWKKLGRDLWPQPYDYLAIDGTPRLEKQFNDANRSDDPMRKASLTFYTLGKTYGHDKVMAAMNAAVTGRPYGKDVMKRFADELNKLTGNPSAASEIPPVILTSAVEWKTAEREITDKAVEGLVQEKNDTGVTLRYDDGTSDGKRSTAGSGHAVVFKAPAGSWAVDGIQMYGGRYGTPEPPKDTFMIFVCDANFEPIQMIERPYSDLGGYDEGWRKISFSPVKVPEGFYVCVYFNPTANKGFYMNYDTSVAKSHSKTALPWTFVYDLEEKRDWMIRPHLVKAE